MRAPPANNYLQIMVANNYLQIMVAYNYLQIMVAHAQYLLHVLLQMLLYSCVIETTLSGEKLADRFPLAVRE